MSFFVVVIGIYLFLNFSLEGGQTPKRDIDKALAGEKK